MLPTQILHQALADHYLENTRWWLHALLQAHRFRSVSHQLSEQGVTLDIDLAKIEDTSTTVTLVILERASTGQASEVHDSESSRNFYINKRMLSGTLAVLRPLSSQGISDLHPDVTAHA